jgi:UDP-glucose 4-epimerase
MRFDAVINKFAFETNFSKRISIQGDGKQWRSFIHIDALTKGLAGLLNANLPAGTYNLTQQNLRVIDILDALKELVPGLEFLFINQHLRLQELRVQTNEAINAALGVPPAAPLKDDLATFLQKFSF